MNVNTVFDVARHALSAQVVRLNTVSSNIANATSVSTTEAAAYRPMRPVFETIYARGVGQSGVSTTRAREVVQLDREPDPSPKAWCPAAPHASQMRQAADRA
ncbi:MAG: flagellar basal body protein [Pseudomonadota bacterium]